MSIEVDVIKQLGERRIATAFTAGEGLTALFGPSGAGKTSVLHMVAGVLRPDKGRILVGGTVLFDSERGIDLPPEARRVGYIFQDGRLFPHMNVRANLLYGHDLTPPADRYVDLADVLDFLGLRHLLDRRPATLSGGEAQRVAIGRALLASPRFLLMDEPLASLDRARKEEILVLIEQLRDTFRLPILYVTHDEREVTRLAATRIDLE
ncbi:molybdenum ABC transporter ATP-binding protein [Pedomonas mirosovicensis]|uniref:molybdenum ABC transporter ATP-binding protein n=1 Tax=Pedomonas mirosovicensis TaxID=2908641 RepID=UPI00216A4585|nr:ATP-binding cassette domain-containing protein [Pedomonas mirosovicensis]MCH8684827.1 ATP-binding cassette domain-containing protein [Pedomonas mirosovicensis]